MDDRKPLCQAHLLDRLANGSRGAARGALTSGYPIAESQRVCLGLLTNAPKTYKTLRRCAASRDVQDTIGTAMIRERTRAAMKVKRGRKERISGHAPFGWDFGSGGRLVENAKEQKAVAWILNLHKRGESLRGIANLLNNRGVAPKRASENKRRQEALLALWRQLHALN
jgi:hypothetical protein